MDFAGKRKWFFLISLLVILPGMVFLVPPIDGLKAGLDFTGGSSLTLLFSESVDQEEVRTVMADLEHPDAIVQGLGDNTYFIRTKELSTEEKNVVVAGVNEALEPSFTSVGRTDADGRVTLVLPSGSDGVTIRAESGERTGSLVVATDEVTPSGELVMSMEPGPNEGEVVLAVSDGEPVGGAVVTIGGVDVIAFDGVSPSVAEETVRNAFYAVLLAAVGIFLYVWWAFRNVPSPFRYSAAAIVALLHDTAIVVGVFAILGELFGCRSQPHVHDRPVDGDRLQRQRHDRGVRQVERKRSELSQPDADTRTVNVSISETISRSLNTSLTLLFTLLALLLLGGSTIREFLLVLLIGVVVGTYSSVGIASQMLVAWDQGDLPETVPPPNLGNQQQSAERLAVPHEPVGLVRLLKGKAARCYPVNRSGLQHIQRVGGMPLRCAGSPRDRGVAEHDLGRANLYLGACYLAHQHQPASLRQAAQSLLEGRRTDGVQHDVRSSVFGQSEDELGERQLAGVDHFQAEAFEWGDFASTDVVRASTRAPRAAAASAACTPSPPPAPVTSTVSPACTWATSLADRTATPIGHDRRHARSRSMSSGTGMTLPSGSVTSSAKPPSTRWPMPAAVETAVVVAGQAALAVAAQRGQRRNDRVAHADRSDFATSVDDRARYLMTEDDTGSHASSQCPSHHCDVRGHRVRLPLP